jgi:hypothetical protein
MATGTVTAPPSTTGAGSSTSFMSDISNHKGLVIGGALVLGIGIYFLMKHEKSSSSTSTSSQITTTGTTQVLVPAGVAGTNQTNNAVLSALQTMEATSSAAMAAQQTAIEKYIDNLYAKQNPGAGSSGSGGSTGSGGSSGTPTYGEGIIKGGKTGKTYVVLGTMNANTQFTGYNVGGGAPVYWGYATTMKQGPTNEKPGAYAYTPITYKNEVAKVAQTDQSRK